ncbi:MAG: hypothetical protein ACRDQ2_05185 [Gaiellales bacterium]
MHALADERVEIDRRRGRVPEIEAHILSALTLPEPLGLRPLAARCHLRLARLYEILGREEHIRHQEVGERLLDQMDRPLSLDAAGLY